MSRDPALLVLLLCLAVFELLTRTVLVDRSQDLRRFADYHERTEWLLTSPGRRLLLVGNSATEEGIDVDLLRVRLEQWDQPASAQKLVADASRINAWHFMLNRYVFRPRRTPDLVVVSFYEDDLMDGNRIEVGRLAHFFTRVDDWPAVFSLDLPHFEERMTFLLSSASAAVAVSNRVQRRSLDLLVPDYQGLALTLNAAAWHHGLGQRTERPAPRSLRALHRLLSAARAHQTRLLFVAYPVPAAFSQGLYPLEPEVLDAIETAGFALLDMRDPRPHGLRPEHYVDDVHLGKEGAALFTEALAAQLLPRLDEPEGR